MPVAKRILCLAWVGGGREFLYAVLEPFIQYEGAGIEMKITLQMLILFKLNIKMVDKYKDKNSVVTLSYQCLLYVNSKSLHVVTDILNISIRKIFFMAMHFWSVSVFSFELIIVIRGSLYMSSNSAPTLQQTPGSCVSAFPRLKMVGVL